MIAFLSQYSWEYLVLLRDTTNSIVPEDGALSVCWVLSSHLARTAGESCAVLSVNHIVVKAAEESFGSVPDAAPGTWSFLLPAGVGWPCSPL